MTTEPKILYHYTSMSTLLKILQGVEETGKLILRGTHIEYLNDRQEYYEAIDLFVELLKQFESQKGYKKDLKSKLNRNNFKALINYARSPFITSFSRNSDSLPMWNTYAEKGQGVAIGIAEDGFNYLADYKFDQSPLLAICEYDKEFYKNAFTENILDEIYKNISIDIDGSISSSIFFNKATFYFSILKNKSFSYENELRLINSCSNNNDPKEIHFHESNGLLKPYINHSIPRYKLLEIVLGPTTQFGLSKKSLEMCLRRAGFSTKVGDPYYVDISQSTIPYRLI